MNGPRGPGDPLRLTATQHLGRAPGGSSGAQLYKVAEIGDIYIVKLKGTTQGIRVLYNEYVSGRLGEFIGVPFGQHALVNVSDALHPTGEPNIRNRLPGIQFGTTYYDNAQSDVAQLRRARNFDSFPSVLVFDTFIARGDGRQFAVYPSTGGPNDPRDTGVIFDQGFAFTGGPDWVAATLNADNNCIANNGLGLKNDFPVLARYEPYIAQVEALTVEAIRTITNEPPLADWQVTPELADAVAGWLDRRKGLVRGAIEAYLR